MKKNDKTYESTPCLVNEVAQTKVFSIFFHYILIKQMWFKNLSVVRKKKFYLKFAMFIYYYPFLVSNFRLASILLKIQYVYYALFVLNIAWVRGWEDLIREWYCKKFDIDVFSCIT